MSERDVTNIAFCSDTLYFPHLVTALTSVVLNCRRPSNVHFWVCGVDVPEREWQLLDSLADSLEFSFSRLVVNRESLEGLHESHHVSRATYVRLLLPELVPSSVTKLLYLDCDVIVLRDIGELFTEPLDGSLLAAVESDGFHRWSDLGIDEKWGYFNSGVMLMDVEQMRSRRFGERVLDTARVMGDRLELWDQDALNVVTQGEWRRLEYSWNVQHLAYRASVRGLTLSSEEADAISSPSIIHYTGAFKPWKFSSTHPRKEAYHSYRASSGQAPVGRFPRSPREFAIRVRNEIRREV
jgi:lipopolysaccharide biosynthesis glycosyltransferase